MEEPSRILEIVIPAISVLLGGLLGGFLVIVGNIVHQRRDVETQKRKFLRDRLEEIYTLSLEAVDWLKNEDLKMQTFISHGKSMLVEEKPLRTDRLRMILNLYFPELSGHVDELDKFETLFYKGQSLAYSTPEEMKDKKYEQSIGKAIELLLVTHLKIRDALKTHIKQYY